MNLKKHFLLLASLVILALSFALTSCSKECKHEYKDEVTAPTCEAGGYTTHTCTKCSNTYVDSKTGATGHNYVDTVTDPTCTAQGYTTHTCSNCSGTYNDNYQPVSAHRFNGDACYYCRMQAPTDLITPDTEWYNEDNIVFTLTTKEQLAGLAELVNSGVTFANATIHLGADIDLGYLAWTPIGNAEKVFKGIFDGDNHTISSLRINSHSSYVGLFGNSTGQLYDFTLDNVSVYVSDANKYISAVCGYSTADIKNVHVDGYIDASNSNYVGSIVGYTTAQISDVTSDTDIVAFDYVGGIAGYVTSGTSVYTRIKNYGTVDGEKYTGGIAGYLISTGTLYIEFLENYADVSGTSYVSGLFGYIRGGASSLITSSKSSSKVAGEYYVGAIAGEASNVKIVECSNEGSSVSASSALIDGTNYYAYLGGYVGKGYIVEKCINASEINYISRGSYVGGIAGYLTCSITDCSNSGSIKGYDYVGGLCGYISSGTNVMVSGLANSGEISGKNFVGGIVGNWIYNSTISFSNSENTGAIFGDEYIGGIIGYMKMSGNQLLTVNNVSNTGSVTGSKGYVGGLFGYINGNSSSTVQNSSSSANVTGSHFVGGLIGYADTITLKDSSNEGSVITATGFIIEGTENNVYLGGYVGRSAAVSGCINTCDINYNSIGKYVGGIAGYSVGNITDCTNNANITSSSDRVGGIAGECNSDANNTYTDLTNNGVVTGTNDVGGIFGRVYQFTFVNDNPKRSMKNLTNYGSISGKDRVGGIIGELYMNNDFYYGAGDVSLNATQITNSGNVVGKAETGEIFGKFWSDGASTLTTYTILGSITVNGEELEGDYSVGSNERLTLSDRLGYEEPAPEEPTE